MCGIVGAIAQKDIVPVLIEGLSRLEYRGYDSAGIAVINPQGIQRVRAVGRVSALQAQAQIEKLSGLIGIGHTRWATHGGVTENNAHPHISRGEIAIVHNGIIENHDEERIRLTKLGYEFTSQTDTEVIAHLIHYYYQQSKDLKLAVVKASAELQGAYAIAAIALNETDKIVVARYGCPLLIGLGQQANYLASDVSAVLAETKQIIYLEDGDIAELTVDTVTIQDASGKQVNRKVHTSDVTLSSMELGPYTHFMQKEIYEQPKAISDTLHALMELQKFDDSLFGEQANEVFQGVDSVLILAAGTSYYAAMTAKYWLEEIAQIQTDVEIASEYRYRSSVPRPSQLVVTISQSGETLDTMEALKHAVKLGHEKTLAICNVLESAIPRASKLVFYTRAGAEIGVASTKAFTTQLIALFILAVTLGKSRGLVDDKKEQEYLS
ncbi:MAG: glutamine--fructose-6-phosphate transaminase (isomerizing), partial [Methylophilaceae bacterium]